MRANWPECAETALIFTKEMDKSLKGQWKKSKSLPLNCYLSGWKFAVTLNCMIHCRSKRLTYLDPTSLPSPVTWMHPLSKKHLPNMHSCCRLRGSRRVTRTDLNKWAAILEDYALIFSFWTRATSIQTSQAVAIKK